jgi:hypothetical protein
MLSFELANEGREIQICCDEEGMAILIRALNKVRAEGDHVHLLTPECGAYRGLELSGKNPSGQDTIPEVIINWAGD